MLKVGGGGTWILIMNLDILAVLLFKEIFLIIYITLFETKTVFNDCTKLQKCDF